MSTNIFPGYGDLFPTDSIGSRRRVAWSLGVPGEQQPFPSLFGGKGMVQEAQAERDCRGRASAPPAVTTGRQVPARRFRANQPPGETCTAVMAAAVPLVSASQDAAA